MKVQSIYNNKFIKRGLKFAAKNGILFGATTSLIFSTLGRPVAILMTPKTEEENRQYAFAKAISSTLVNYFTMLIASTPVSKALSAIDKNPEEYLKTKTIDALKAGEKELHASSKYNFATQLFMLGLGLIIAAPKSIMSCKLIPDVMEKVFKNEPPRASNEGNSEKNKNLLTENYLLKRIQHKKNGSKETSFTGTSNPLAKVIGKGIESDFVQKLTDKFHKTNFEQHIINFTDVVSTATFIQQVQTSKKIKEKKKNVVCYQAGISTGLSVAGCYTINKLTQKSTEKFINKFKEINKNDPELPKYLEGIRIAKPALILASIYYILIPMISTFISDKLDANKENKKSPTK